MWRVQLEKHVEVKPPEQQDLNYRPATELKTEYTSFNSQFSTCNFSRRELNLVTGSICFKGIHLKDMQATYLSVFLLSYPLLSALFHEIL